MNKKIGLLLIMILIGFQFVEAQDDRPRYKVEASLRLNPAGRFSIGVNSDYYIGIRALSLQAPGPFIPVANADCNDVAGYTISERNTFFTTCDFEWVGDLPNIVNFIAEGRGFTSIERTSPYQNITLQGGDEFSVFHTNSYGSPISPCQFYSSWDDNTDIGTASSLTLASFRFIPRDGQEAQLVGGSQVANFNLDTPFQFELNSGLPASWQYTLDFSEDDNTNFNWSVLPSGVQTLSGLGVTLADLPSNGKVRFRGVVCSSNGVYTTPATITVTGADIPDLVGPVNPLAPTCHFSGVGTDGLDGGFTGTFDKDIGDNRKLVFIVFSEGPPGIFDDIVGSDEVRQADLDNRTFTYNEIYEDLPPGRYRFKWMTGPDVQGDDLGIGDETVGKISEPFDIPNPPQVVINSFTPNNVTCEGEANGSITQINVAGGSIPYRYVLSDSGGTSTEYTTNSISNLVAGEYTLSVLDVNGCASAATTIDILATSSTPTLVAGTTNVNQLNEVPLGNAFINLGVIPGEDASFSFAWTKSPDDGFTSTDRNISNLSPGNYSVVISSGGCPSVPYEFTIQEPPALSVTIGSNGEIYCAGDTAILEATASNGSFTGYTYEWFRGTVNDELLPETTNTLETNQGTYTVRVTDSGGNNTTNTFILNYVDRDSGTVITTPLSVTEENITPVLCRGESTGRINLNISGGTGTYRVFWDGSLSEGPQDNTALATGNHTYEVIDSNNCSILGGPIFIDEPTDNLNINIDLQSNVSTNGGSDGRITISTQGGTPPYLYQWEKDNIAFTPSSETDLINLSAGVYKLTLRDNNGIVNSCEIEETITINQPGPLAILDPQFELVPVACFGESSGRITARYSGTPEYTFTWFNGTTQLKTGEEDFIENLPAGTEYYYTVTDASGVTLTSSQIVITEPTTALTANFNQTEVNCFGGNNGTITVTAEGGTPPYQYAFSGGLAAQPTPGTFTNLEAGNYSINVTDDNGCTLPNPLIITLAAPEQITFDDVNAVTPVSSPNGSDGRISVTVQGGVTPYFYRWTGPGTLTPINTENTTVIENLTVGNYSLEVSNNPSFVPNGCYFTRTYTVTEQQAFSVTNIAPTPTCFAPINGTLTATVEATGNVLHNWRNSVDDSLVASETTTVRTVTATGLAAGTYYLEIVDVADNTITARSIDVEIESLANVDADIDLTPTCSGLATGVITFSNPTGSLTDDYLFSIDGGITFENSLVFNNLAADTYQIVIRATDNINCDRIVTDVVIPTSPALLYDEGNTLITRASGPTANDGAITVAFVGGTGAYQYSIDNGVTLQNGPEFTGLAAGVYTITVTDPAGCSLSQNIEVTATGPLSITNIVANDALCRDEATGSIETTVTGEGTITYQWTLADGNPVPVSNGTDGEDITGILAGSYLLTVTDDNATVTSSPITIGEPATVLAIQNITSTNSSCNGANDGTIQIVASGGTPPYQYSVNGIDFQNAATFNNLTAGQYSITVSDANGCLFTEPTPQLLTEPLLLSFIINEQRPLTAANAANGAILISPEGGSGDYTYNWTGPNFTSTEEDIFDLEGGDYVLTLTDANNPTCSIISAPITIAEPGVLIATNVQTVLLECNGDDFGEIVATAQGGVAPFTYEWFQVVNGNNDQLAEDTDIIANLSAGTYFVRITDANDVVAEAAPVLINQPPALQITVDATTNVLCNGQATGAIAISVNGGTFPYQYVWSNGVTVEDINGLDAGIYTVEVIDANGCIAEESITLTTPDDAVQIADASLTNVSEYNTLDGSISLDVIGGLAPYSYTWIRLSDNSNVGAQANISNLTADTYTVSISDTNGCTVTETYEITQPDIVEDTIVPPTCTGESNGSISVLVNQGNGTFTYAWSTGGTTNNITNLAAGSYSVTITGFGDGPLTRTYVLEDPEPLEVNLGEDRVLCADQVLELDATVEDPSAIYSWSSDNGFTSSSPIVSLTSTGNYTVTVQSQTGCATQGNVFVDISTDEIDAEFAISSQVFAGERTIAVDISFPLPETIAWEIPLGGEIVTQNNDEVELVFATPGEYEIGITTTRGGCIAQKRKKIIVVAKNGAIEDEDAKNGQKLVEDFIVYPNPTSGRFTADINLTERGTVSVKVFSFANNAMVTSENDRGETSYSIPFDISGMPSGVYAVLLETSYGTSLRKVIMN